MKCTPVFLSLGILIFGIAHTEAQSGVVNISNYAGSDHGREVNDAFASAGGSSAAPVPSYTVVISPGRTLAFSVPIEIPNSSCSLSSSSHYSSGSAPCITAPTLDCQGSTLNYTGSGDAIIVHGANAAGPGQTGSIRNCNIVYGTSHASGVALIHIKGRLGFTLSNDTLSGGQYCLDWENRSDDGGPGYNEENNFEHIESNRCTEHIRAHVGTGGTPSFEYNRIDDWHFTLQNYNGEEHGLSLDAGSSSFDMQGSVLDLKTNSQGTSGSSDPLVALIYLASGNGIFRSHVNLHGENTAGLAKAYSVYNAGGLFYAEGNNEVTGYGTNGGRTVTHPGLTDVSNDVESGKFVHIETEQGGGGAVQRQCKFDFSNSARFWLASYGGAENDCQFQVLARNTDNTNVDVYHAGSGSSAVNVLYADPATKSVGVGAGFGINSATGTNQPTSTLDVHGSIGVSNPGLNQDGTQVQRSLDSSGNIIDYIHSGIAGQPSSQYRQRFYDFTTYATVDGFTSWAAGGQVHNFVFSIGNTRGTPSSSTDACVQGESWDDANYHYHCVSTNMIKRVALSSF